MANSTFVNLGPNGPRELASGIDTLIISLRGVLSEELAMALSEAKATALELQSPVDISIGGSMWQLQSGRFGMYPYSLKHEYGLLGITDSLHLPTMRWQPRAEVLHAIGAGSIASWLMDIAEAEIGPVVASVSRLDIHADFQGLFLSPEDKESFVCLARSCVANWDEGVFSGFTFGSRRSKSMLARLYDKSLEISKKGGTYWYDIWGPSWEPDETVWRIEFEFHRSFLRKFGITTLGEAFQSVGGLWKYATNDWLSLRIPTLDETHSRWPVNSAWRAVQDSSMACRSISLERVQETRRDDALHRTIPQLNGWLARTGALLGLENVEEVIDVLPDIVEMYERSSKKLFPDRIQYSRKKLMLP